MINTQFRNPFRPGAGHQPPYLAGRATEKREFLRLLEQDIIIENMILTGLRGVGKTVLFDSFAPLAVENNWYWVGTDLSQAASVSEETLVIRIFSDLAAITADIVIDRKESRQIGFARETVDTTEIKLNSAILREIYDSTPGLASDKLKETLRLAWQLLAQQGKRGIIFAYDEAQNLSDTHSGKGEYPLSMLLDVFQSLQKSGLPLMLVLSGLPILFPKLVETRTYSERMFRVVSLESLNYGETRKAVLKPIAADDCPVKLNDTAVKTIYEMSDGYPYFIQFICYEIYKAFIQRHSSGDAMFVPVKEIRDKLDIDFFAGRWQRATDRQRHLMSAAAHISRKEFSVREIVDSSDDKLDKPFKPGGQVNHILNTLIERGLIFRNRHGRYSFAVPMFDDYIRRHTD